MLRQLITVTQEWGQFCIDNNTNTEAFLLRPFLYAVLNSSNIKHSIGSWEFITDPSNKQVNL